MMPLVRKPSMNWPSLTRSGSNMSPCLAASICILLTDEIDLRDVAERIDAMANSVRACLHLMERSEHAQHRPLRLTVERRPARGRCPSGMAATRLPAAANHSRMAERPRTFFSLANASGWRARSPFRKTGLPAESFDAHRSRMQGRLISNHFVIVGRITFDSIRHDERWSGGQSLPRLLRFLLAQQGAAHRKLCLCSSAEPSREQRSRSSSRGYRPAAAWKCPSSWGT